MDDELWLCDDVFADSDTIDCTVSVRVRSPLRSLGRAAALRELNTKPRSRVAMESMFIYLCLSAKRLIGGSAERASVAVGESI